MGRSHLQEVAPGVLVATSRFLMTNTVVLVTGRRALVVDPGVHPDELVRLVTELDERGLTVVGGFATHAHWDHVLWHPGLGDVPRWASPRTVADAEARRDELVAEAAATTEVDTTTLAHLVAAGETLPWPGPEAVLVEHDAHLRGHAALHVPRRGLLVAGDMGSDVEVPLLDPGVPGPDALAAHHDGLDRLAALEPVEVAVTGHGHVCDGAGWRRRLAADRRYLDQLASGRRSDDPRLVASWLLDADAAMRDALSKPAWRRWARALPSPAPHAPAVRSALAQFLGPSPGTVAAYVALPDEVDLAGLFAGSAGALLGGATSEGPGGATAPPVRPGVVALPRIGDDDQVRWHRSGGTGEPHRTGVVQPDADAAPIDPADLDVVLVPGRLFDRHGIRLGRGGGHYDRLVPVLGDQVRVVGVTVDARVVDRLPTEAHDAPMTHLATETGVRAVG